jgi:hypothetical protein
MALVLNFKFGHPAGGFPADGMPVHFARDGPKVMAMGKTIAISGLRCLPSPIGQSYLDDSTDFVGGFRHVEA